MKQLTVLLALGTYSFALSPAEEAKVKSVAQEYIKDHLKAPATALFSKETLCAPRGKADFDEVQGIGPIPECKPQAVAKLGEKDSVVYRGSVDSQNSFGALIRTKFQLHIYVFEGKLKILDAGEVVRSQKEGCDVLNEAKKALGERGIRDCNAEFPGIK